MPAGSGALTSFTFSAASARRTSRTLGTSAPVSALTQSALTSFLALGALYLFGRLRSESLGACPGHGPERTGWPVCPEVLILLGRLRVESLEDFRHVGACLDLAQRLDGCLGNRGSGPGVLPVSRLELLARPVRLHKLRHAELHGEAWITAVSSFASKQATKPSRILWRVAAGVASGRWIFSSATTAAPTTEDTPIRPSTTSFGTMRKAAATPSPAISMEAGILAASLFAWM